MVFSIVKSWVLVRVTYIMGRTILHVGPFAVSWWHRKPRKPN